jgi:hypothetical protein
MCNFGALPANFSLPKIGYRNSNTTVPSAIGTSHTALEMPLTLAGHEPPR